MTTPGAASDYVGGLPAGFLLQEYQIERVLGHGGFGVTYLARDTMLQKAVAIKEYLPTEWAVREAGHTVSVRSSTDRPAYEQGLSSFLNEARVLARFSHPHLIGVYRFFQANNTAYFVMEYAEGHTLRAHVKKEGMLPEARIRALLLPVMQGLEGVHGEGILHRDIKPDNILVKKDGNAILIDFGAARYAVGSASRAITSVLTVGFAPIEQYSTHSSQGAWTDIYALGAVMYYLIAGHKPIDAIARLENDPLEPASAMGRERFSAPFLSAIDWALRVKAEERPQSLTEWREGLEGKRAVPAFAPPAPKRATVPEPDMPTTRAPAPAEALTPTVQPARPVTAPATAAAPARRPRSAWIAGGAAAVVIAASAAWWLLAQRQAALAPASATAPAPATVEPAPAQPAPARAPVQAKRPAPAPEVTAKKKEEPPPQDQKKEKKTEDIPVGF